MEMNIKQKIEKIGKPLKDWDISINYGIKTGFNEAFIIDGQTKDALITKSPKNAEIIRPILRGRDIKKYKTEFADLWLIATLPSLKINIDDYPDIKNHLLSFGKERLEQSGNIGARKKTGNKWFETQDAISYYKEFEEGKIIWKRIGSILRFAYEKSNIYPLDSTCFLVGKNLNYLLAILNSNIGFYQLLQNAPKTGTGDVIISVQALEPILIPITCGKNIEILHSIVSSILSNIEHNIPIDNLEQNINRLLYDIYDFNEEEIKNIERFIKTAQY